MLTGSPCHAATEGDFNGIFGKKFYLCGGAITVASVRPGHSDESEESIKAPDNQSRPDVVFIAMIDY